MRWALGAGAAVLVFALALAVALVLAPSGRGGSSVVVAVHPGCVKSRLLRVDPSTLEPRGGTGLDLGGYYENPVRSPDGKTVALGGHSGTIVIANVASMRRVATLRIASPGEYTSVVAWPASNRLVATSWGNDSHVGLGRVAVLDPATGRVRRELRLHGRGVLGGGATRTGRVPLLIESERRLDAPQVMVVGPHGGLEGVRLSRLRAGTDASSRQEARSRRPAFTVDPESDRAFVINQGQPVAIVDLRTLKVRYRAVPQLAVAAPGVGQPTHRQDRARVARWLGSGLIAVSGMDVDLRNEYAPPVVAGKQRPGWKRELAYAGLQLLDTKNWTVRTLSPRVSGFEWQGGRLVAYARSPYGSGGDALVAFDRTGRVVYRIHGTKNTYWRSFNNRIYLFGDRPGNTTTVIDARDGRKLGHARFSRLLAVGPC